MMRKIRTDEEKIEIQKKALEKRLKNELEKNNFNANYKKTRFHKFSIFIRIFGIIFCLYFYFFDKVVFYPSTENIISNRTWTETVYNRGKPSYEFTYQEITTKSGSFTLVISNDLFYSKPLENNEDVIVGKSIINTPISIFNPKTKVDYTIKKHFITKQFFILLGILIIISFFIRNHYDLSGRYFVYFTTYFTIALIAIYITLNIN